MDNVLRASKSEKGVIVHESGDGESRREYITIRGAISWPIFGENVPGYYLILGEEHVRHFEGQEQQYLLCNKRIKRRGLRWIWNGPSAICLWEKNINKHRATALGRHTRYRYALYQILGRKRFIVAPERESCP